MASMNTLKIISLLVFVVFLIAACNPTETEPSASSPDLEPAGGTDELIVTPTVDSNSALPSPRIETIPIATVPSNSLPEVEPSPTTIVEATQHGDTPRQSHPVFQVAYVEAEDTLNVREGPGVEFGIRGEIKPGVQGLTKIESANSSSNDLWFRIDDGELDGWVNSRYLVEIDNPEGFCQSADVVALLEELLIAMSLSDGTRLKELVAESRGIGIRRHWWNPEVYYRRDDVAKIFNENESHYWGTADGSGDDIEGTFSEVMGQLVTNNLLNSTETGCNEIIHGGTAGLTVLPASYEGINFVSLHRSPEPDEFELDWGTWVIGIERWEGEYYISFMVHYEWEI